MSTAGDIFEVYFDMVEPCSEAPFIYHRWALLSGIGAMLARQVYLPFGFDTFYPNSFSCLIGNAGSRKSAAISVARKVLEGAGYNKFAREKSSKEKFLSDLSLGFEHINTAASDNPYDVGDVVEEALSKRMTGDVSDVFVCAGELEDFLGSNDQAFISLLTNLWDNLPKYEHAKQTGKDVYVHAPTVTLIGGATPTTFATVFPPEVIGQGMLSRLLLIYGGGARCKITFPPAPNAELFDFITSHLVKVRKHCHGPMQVAPETRKIWDDIYQSRFPIEDARLESYTGRRHVHYYKLCMILAAADLSMTIEPEHAILANTILHYAEQLMPKALGEFGRSNNSNVTQHLLNAIRNNPQGIRIDQLFKLVSSEFNDIKECSMVARKLMDSGKITAKGNLLFPLQEAVTTNYPHIDWSLLREYDSSMLKKKG